MIDNMNILKEEVDIRKMFISSKGIRKYKNSFKHFKKIDKSVFSKNFVFNFGYGGSFEFT